MPGTERPIRASAAPDTAGLVQLNMLDEQSGQIDIELLTNRP